MAIRPTARGVGRALRRVALTVVLAPLVGWTVLRIVQRLPAGVRARQLASTAEDILDLASSEPVNINVFPNFSLLGNHIQVFEPIAVDETNVTWYGTAVVDEDGELDVLDAPDESGESESAAATAVATAEPVPATTPAIATPRHTRLIVVTSDRKSVV